MYPVLSRIIKNADYLTLIAKFPDENVIAKSHLFFYYIKVVFLRVPFFF